MAGKRCCVYRAVKRESVKQAAAMFTPWAGFTQRAASIWGVQSPICATART